MASHESKIRVYMRLHERLQKGDYPSKEDLILAAREIGEDIAERTLDRYRKNMFLEFGWKVQFNRLKNGYELIAEEDAQDVGLLNEVFGQSVRAAFLSSVLRPDSKQLVLFENRNDYPGIQYLEPLFKCCRERREIIIGHRKFQSQEDKVYTIHPVFLKEYQNRWYIAAWVPERDDYRIFGLERILHITETENKFSPPPKLEEEREIYNYMVGVNKGNEKIEKVRLKFHGIGVEYEKTLPLHHSGKVVEEGDNWAVFEYQVILNFEFIQRILSQADRVEVLAPKSLLDMIKESLRKALINNTE